MLLPRWGLMWPSCVFAMKTNELHKQVIVRPKEGGRSTWVPRLLGSGPAPARPCVDSSFQMAGERM